MLNQSIRVRDLPQSDKWKPVTDGETMLVHVVLPKAEESRRRPTRRRRPRPPSPKSIKKGKTTRRTRRREERLRRP